MGNLRRGQRAGAVGPHDGRVAERAAPTNLEALRAEYRRLKKDATEAAYKYRLWSQREAALKSSTQERLDAEYDRQEEGSIEDKKVRARIAVAEVSREYENAMAERRAAKEELDSVKTAMEALKAIAYVQKEEIKQAGGRL
jgi:hypothetical protein